LDGRRVIPTCAALPGEIKHRDKMHDGVSLGAAREAKGASREAKERPEKRRERLEKRKEWLARLVEVDRLG
jgi:hypothetical protein